MVSGLYLAMCSVPVCNLSGRVMKLTSRSNVMRCLINQRLYHLDRLFHLRQISSQSPVAIIHLTERTLNIFKILIYRAAMVVENSSNF